MPQLRYSAEESSKRARAIYESVREKVDTPENEGKPFFVDVVNGVWEIDHEDVSRGSYAEQRLRDRNPDARIHALRVAWIAFSKMGGSWAGIAARARQAKAATGSH